MKTPVSPLLRGTACTLSLYHVYLTPLGISLRTVGQLTGQSRAFKITLAPREFARVSRRLPRPLRRKTLHHKLFPLLGIFFKITPHFLKYYLVYGRTHLGIPQLGLGLPLKLRLLKLYRYNRRYTFSYVLSGKLVIFLHKPCLTRIISHRLAQSRLEPLKMRASFFRVYIVGIRKNGFGVAVIELQRYLHLSFLHRFVYIKRLSQKNGFVFVQTLHKLLHSAFIMKSFPASPSLSLVFKRYLYPLVQIRQLPQPVT